MTAFWIVLAAAAALACAAFRLSGARTGRDGFPVAEWTRVRAEVLGIAPESYDMAASGRGCGRYVLVCGYSDPLTGEEYRFRAGGLSWDGQAPLPGSSVDVYVDPDSGYGKYVVDLGSLYGAGTVRRE